MDYQVERKLTPQNGNYQILPPSQRQPLHHSRRWQSGGGLYPGGRRGKLDGSIHCAGRGQPIGYFVYPLQGKAWTKRLGRSQRTEAYSDLIKHAL